MNSNFIQNTGLVIILFAFGFSTVYADNGTSKLQLIKIKNTMAGGDYVSAWSELRKLEKTDTLTSELYYLGGECNFYLKNYEDAMEQLNRSIALDGNANPEKYFFIGKIFQLAGELDKAINEYQTFIEKSPKKSEETEEASLLITQCKKSIEMMLKPINVKISNIGTSINSEYSEYNPSISADGQTMIFTSRRPESTGKKVDEEDGKFYEDIYISKKDSLTGKWLEAENIPGDLNEENHDANMTLSPDGKQIFVYRNKGLRGSGTLYVSKKSPNGKWKKAEELEGDVNTSYFESSACLSPDGKTLYFVSERPRGGMGMGDIYMAKKKSKTEWEKAVSLGPNVNDEYDQIGLFMHPDGKTLYYASNSPKSLGGYDIFKTTIENGICSEPENLGYPINTPGDERNFCLSTDGRQAWFSSDRNGGKGDIDIWEIDFSSIVEASKVKTSNEQEVQVPKGPPISILKGHIIDSDASQIVETELSVTDKENGKVFNINSDENGDYFITLEGDRTYVVEVKNPIYKTYRFEVPMKSLSEGTYTKEQLIVLDRLKK